MTQSADSYVIAANSDGLPNQDYIVLGGGSAGSSSKSPGRAVVKGLPRPQGWDERKGNAITGATVVPTGAPLSRFTVVITVWAGVQYEAWKIFAAAYLARAAVVTPGTVTTKALSIAHPMVNDPPFGITEVVVENVVALEEDADGMYSYEISFLEYRKPIPAVGKPAAAIPVATPPQPTAQDKAIAANTAKIQALAGLAPTVPR